jgi:hypothetical protein
MCGVKDGLQLQVIFAVSQLSFPSSISSVELVSAVCVS